MISQGAAQLHGLQVFAREEGFYSASMPIKPWIVGIFWQVTTPGLLPMYFPVYRLRMHDIVGIQSLFHISHGV